MRVTELREAYRRAAAALRSHAPTVPSVRIPAGVLLWLQRWNPFSHSLTWSRRSLQRFWRSCAANLKRGRLDRLDVSGVVFNVLQELSLFATFATLFFSRLLVRLFARTTTGT